MNAIKFVPLLLLLLLAGKAAASTPSSLAAELADSHRITYVYDGDTVKLDNGDRVRLVGINAPEIRHPDKPGQLGGEEARAALAAWIDGKNVRLRIELDPRDHYGRLLAHLIDAKGEDLNARLVREGLAHVVVHPPNTLSTRKYFALEAQARRERKGIWRLGQYRLAPVTDAWEWPDCFRRLQGRVSRVFDSRRYVTLDLEHRLMVRVHRYDLHYFRDNGVNLHALKGKTIVVRGWVHRHGDVPAMYLDHPLEIERIE